jgi:hypothetical protein
VSRNFHKDYFFLPTNVPCGGGFIGSVIYLNYLVGGFPTKNLKVVPRGRGKGIRIGRRVMRRNQCGPWLVVKKYIRVNKILDYSGRTLVGKLFKRKRVKDTFDKP